MSEENKDIARKVTDKYEIYVAMEDELVNSDLNAREVNPSVSHGIITEKLDGNLNSRPIAWENKQGDIEIVDGWQRVQSVLDQGGKDGLEVRLFHEVDDAVEQADMENSNRDETVHGKITRAKNNVSLWMDQGMSREEAEKKYMDMGSSPPGRKKRYIEASKMPFEYLELIKQQDERDHRVLQDLNGRVSDERDLWDFGHVSIGNCVSLSQAYNEIPQERFDELVVAVLEAKNEDKAEEIINHTLDYPSMDVEEIKDQALGGLQNADVTATIVIENYPDKKINILDELRSGSAVGTYAESLLDEAVEKEIAEEEGAIVVDILIEGEDADRFEDYVKQEMKTSDKNLTEMKKEIFGMGLEAYFADDSKQIPSDFASIDTGMIAELSVPEEESIVKQREIEGLEEDDGL